MGNIIEFYGPPGGGKSTLAYYCISYLRKNDITILDPKTFQYQGYKRWLSREKGRPIQTSLLKSFLNIMPEKLVDDIVDETMFPGKHRYRRDMFNLFVLQNPEVFEILVKNINNLYDHDKGKKVLGWFQDDISKYQSVKEYFDVETIMFDEAFCQRILSLYSTLRTDKSPKTSKRDIVEMVSKIAPHIDIALFIHAEAETCLGRQEERGEVIQGFMECSDEKERLRDLSQRIEYARIIHKALKKNGVTSIKIDADGSIGSSKKALRKRLDEILPYL